MAGTSAKTGSTVEIVNITPRRRWSVGEKVRLIEASMAPGQSVSLVARTYGVEKWVHFFGPVNGKTKVDSFIGYAAHLGLIRGGTPSGLYC